MVNNGNHCIALFEYNNIFKYQICINLFIMSMTKEVQLI
jgi:hypothetical protein